MSKNRIIPQMFDVRPVDETGDLDWKKIKSVCPEKNDFRKNVLKKKEETKRQKEQQRFLQLEQQNIFFEKNEIARRKQEEQLKIENQRREAEFLAAKLMEEQKRTLILENEKKRLERQQQAVMEKIHKIHKGKEQEIIAQKRIKTIEKEESIRIQALKQQEELKRAAEFNRKQSQAYQEFVLEEKRKRELLQAQWLENELRAEAKARLEQELVAKKIAKAKKRENLRKKIFGSKNSQDYFSFNDLFSKNRLPFQFNINKSLGTFALVSMFVFVGIGGITYVSKGAGIKGRVLASSADGLANLNSAIGEIKNQNFENSSNHFSEAYANFSNGADELDTMGGILIDATRFVPFVSKISSGKNAVEAGKHFSAAGKSINEVARISSQFKNTESGVSSKDISLLDVLENAKQNIAKAKIELDAAQQNIDRISIDDLPVDKQQKFLLLKQSLPELRSSLDFFLNNSQIFVDLLGGNGPRKYLFLFQNNSEMRATGGFIGSYGLIDIANGHVKKFFIDGIFNPDGQLRDKIVPPAPIQKISANWSMHDSNWFADFPLSAKKSISFYEKTGGPTADGVITLTPTMMQKLLEITGPIEMPEYDVTLNSENFVELTQNEVEVEYDKQENKPKKILSDLAPMVLEKLLSSKNIETISKTAAALLEGLEEKHILLYSENVQLQKIISQQGWSGEVLDASRDYVSVINTNINGYKTDAMIEETILHQAEIQEDGSIIDTLTITRKHNGGNSDYEWFNKVNADYLRVYVPNGSKLLEVSGQTRETGKPPLDYDALDFKRDIDVQNQENSMIIDQSSGTRIYQESEKTVFANWVYVSPQETVTVVYKYLLPFKLFQVSVKDKQEIDSYSLVAQKQSGSIGSKFVSQVLYPKNYSVKWNFPVEFEKNNNGLKVESTLKTDRYVALLFEKR